MKPVALNIPDFKYWRDFFHYGYVTHMMKENLVLEIGRKISQDNKTVCVFGKLGVFSDYTKTQFDVPFLGEELKIVDVRHDYDNKDIQIGYEEVTKELQDRFNEWVNNFLA